MDVYDLGEFPESPGALWSIGTQLFISELDHHRLIKFDLTETGQIKYRDRYITTVRLEPGQPMGKIRLLPGQELLSIFPLGIFQQNLTDGQMFGFEREPEGQVWVNDYQDLVPLIEENLITVPEPNRSRVETQNLTFAEDKNRSRVETQNLITGYLVSMKDTSDLQAYDAEGTWLSTLPTLHSATSQLHQLQRDGKNRIYRVETEADGSSIIQIYGEEDQTARRVAMRDPFLLRVTEAGVIYLISATAIQIYRDEKVQTVELNEYQTDPVLDAVVDIWGHVWMTRQVAEDTTSTYLARAEIKE